MSDPFVAERDRLWGLAYRMLASRADADDAVQDAWLRWQGADHDTIVNPAAWLTTVTSRLALDRLRHRQHERESYVGPWLPEPVLTDHATRPVGVGRVAHRRLPHHVGTARAHRARRAPARRCIRRTVPRYLRRHGQVGAACRQIASRARTRVRDEHRHSRRPVDAEERTRLVDAFTRATLLGDLEGLAALLAPDVTLVSDGGADQHAARRPIVGVERVSRFLVGVAGHVGGGTTTEPVWVNGEPGLVLRFGPAVVATVAFEVDDGRIERIYIVVNPSKLAGLR